MPVDGIVNAALDARLVRTFQRLEQRATAQRIDHGHDGQADGGQEERNDDLSLVCWCAALKKLYPQCYICCMPRYMKLVIHSSIQTVSQSLAEGRSTGGTLRHAVTQASPRTPNNLTSLTA